MKLQQPDVSPRLPERGSDTPVCRAISVLGSTGSIGRNVLRVVDEFPERFEVVALAAGKNIDELAKQVAYYRPQFVSVAQQADIESLRARLRQLAVRKMPEMGWGDRGLAVATVGWLQQRQSVAPAMIVAAMVGTTALQPVYEAVLRGCSVALANKELIVAAGALLIEAADRSGAAILPVDSEPNAIHQCLRAGEHSEIERVILTASGGPFRELPISQLATVTPDQALRHPTWRMGRRITIDSATLMNKGFEVIEACHLFRLKDDQIEVVIHPQSIIHSLVEFRDGSVLAQLGVPDMRTPIQYALTFPERVASNRQRLQLQDVSRLEFQAPDEAKFPCLRLARQAYRAGGIHPAVLNAADEVAVDAFCAGRIAFTDIASVVAEVLDRIPGHAAAKVEAITQADTDARRVAEERIREKSGTRNPSI